MVSSDAFYILQKIQDLNEYMGYGFVDQWGEPLKARTWHQDVKILTPNQKPRLLHFEKEVQSSEILRAVLD